MADRQNVFSRKHAEAMAQDKRAILEELNLPPTAIEFVRANSRALLVALVVAVLAILGWEGYGKYTTSRQARSADLLYQAMQAKVPEQRLADLKTLSAKYGGQGSGPWGVVEQGHLAFKDGKYQEAAALYQTALQGISSSSPLAPLLRYDLARAYENASDAAKAKEQFAQLATAPGFAGEADLGLARIAEQEGKNAEALAKYQAYVDLPETKDGPTKDWVKDKISNLGGAGKQAATKAPAPDGQGK